MLALKSMIGSTAQQFHTYLSHRGEETGNIRGSMRVRVPAERMGTRERLYGNASVCKLNHFKTETSKERDDLDTIDQH